MECGTQVTPRQRGVLWMFIQVHVYMYMRVFWVFWVCMRAYACVCVHMNDAFTRMRACVRMCACTF